MLILVYKLYLSRKQNTLLKYSKIIGPAALIKLLLTVPVLVLSQAFPKDHKECRRGGKWINTVSKKRVVWMRGGIIIDAILFPEFQWHYCYHNE